jgi:hypothetical protein
VIEEMIDSIVPASTASSSWRRGEHFASTTNGSFKLIAEVNAATETVDCLHARIS